MKFGIYYSKNIIFTEAEGQGLYNIFLVEKLCIHLINSKLLIVPLGDTSGLDNNLVRLSGTRGKKGRTSKSYTKVVRWDKYKCRIILQKINFNPTLMNKV